MRLLRARCASALDGVRASAGTTRLELTRPASLRLAPPCTGSCTPTEIPPQGVSGLLVVADPEDGCQPLKPPHPADLQLHGEAAAAWAALYGGGGGGGGEEAPWIALMARSQDKEGCTFDVKVRGRGRGQVVVPAGLWHERRLLV